MKRSIHLSRDISISLHSSSIFLLCHMAKNLGEKTFEGKASNGEKMNSRYSKQVLHFTVLVHDSFVCFSFFSQHVTI